MSRTLSKLRRYLLAVVFTCAILLAALAIRPQSASAGSAGMDLSPCSWQVGWCVCSVYHWTSGHDDVVWYTNYYGYTSNPTESRYVGAGWTYYQYWFDGHRRGDIFTVQSWGDVAINYCGIGT